MAEIIGRPLRRDEHVHHRDGNGLNNDLSNLQICSPSEHRAIHAAQRRKKADEHWEKVKEAMARYDAKRAIRRAEIATEQAA
jgi:hypothetical protein